jgi:hypothetical protein
MKRGLFALIFAVSACAPSLTPMSKDEAEEVLGQFARGQAPADACSDEGRLMLRSAAHSYAEALYKEGRIWPDLPALLDDGLAPDAAFSDLDAFVLGAVISGFVKPSDLRGPGRSMTAFVHMVASHDPSAPATPAQLQYACAELFALHQATARYAVMSQRHRHAMELARRRNDGERQAELYELYGRSDQRAQREIERLEAAFERKIAEAPEGVSRNAP